ncbi:DUF2169 domain-containing protein [Rhizobacter sp. Root16D2]|uniref:DUF2169 family type VI secretion system accessory protein n=1 Tax=Rhizobacter sp. Root16D2 TaxID=1736479 RepID=UPI0006F8F69D|nr:DUF2169 domain-containing protein [Rhizobacter sp. Root16D2]KRB24765.1 hypothetical protein ASE08_00770 [Rhizobacter sp. Root16D2]
MEFLNESGMPAQWTMAFDRGGREMLVVAAKVTFSIPRDGEPVTRELPQVPLVMADEFEGEPGLSAPAHETDFASFKPMCDVLLAGHAHAPGARPVREVAVGIRVGSLTKAFQVTGPRHWHGGLLGARPGRPELFASMPISYANAFGGTEPGKGEGSNVRAYAANPVGRGFSPSGRHLDGLPMPVTQELGQEIHDSAGQYRPMAFGPVGRNWHPRYTHAGTYDQAWQDERAPYWPDDFDFLYFQSAPADQRLPYLQGGEPVLLRNLSPEGTLGFEIPRVPLQVLLMPHRGEPELSQPVIDTLVIEPEARRFTLTWRLTHRLRQHCFELKRVVVGDITPTRRRELVSPHKTSYRSLGELVQARRGRS